MSSSSSIHSIDGNERSATTVKAVKVLAIVGCLGLISIGCFGFWFSWHTYRAGDEIDTIVTLISTYMILFGLVTFLAECKTRLVFHPFAFLASRFGRALTYIFIGSLVFVHGLHFETSLNTYYFVVIGMYEMVIGILLLLTYCCAASGDAGIYKPTVSRGGH